jgi:uncharacterized protein (TIGR03435 family)
MSHKDYTTGEIPSPKGDSGGRISGKQLTMTGLARMLAIFLKRPMVDSTGLQGYYDFDAKWSAPESPDGKPPADSFGADGDGLLVSNLRDQLGL